MHSCQQVGICNWLLHRENLLVKMKELQWRCRPPRHRRGLPPVSRFLPTRELSNNHHNPASHHECKNTRHRDSAPTAHTAER